MRKGKYAKSGVATKALILTLSLVLMISATIGGTLAWLMDTDDAVTNTFTQSDIDIELDETTQQANNYQFQMIPGFTIAKDPKVTVKGGSEDCFLFVKIDETGGNVEVDSGTKSFGDFIQYNVITGASNDALLENETYWKPLGDSNPGVYYCKVKATEDDVEFPVIWYDVNDNDTMDSGEENKVKVNDTVTKEMMDALKANTSQYPKLTFTAYAVQLYKSNGVEFTAAEAWENAQTLNPDSGT